METPERSAAQVHERVVKAKAAVDRAEEKGWLFAADVRDGIDALEERLNVVLKENLRLRAHQRTGRIKRERERAIQDD